MPELQHPDIVGNFLSSYGTAQAQQQAQQDREFNKQRIMKQDQYAEEDRAHQDAARKTDIVARAALALDTPEKWAAQAPAIMASIGATGPVPGFDQRGRIIAEAQSVSEQLKAKMDERKFALDERQTNAAIKASEANAAQSYAAADYSRRRAAAPSGAGGVTVDPETGALVVSPGAPNMKLTESQSKDLGFYQRGVKALAKLDDDRSAAMSTPWNSTFGEAPFGLGNVLQTQSSRQGKQAAADFLSAILRKDSGAALTKSDFDIYSNIFMPQMGDDPDTLAQKKASREQSLQSLRAGLGTARILADVGAPPLPGLSGEKTPPPADSAATPAAFKYDANGNRVKQ